MANATVTLAAYDHPKGYDNTQRRQVVNGSCTLLVSGTYITNGIPITWGNIAVLQNAPLPQTAAFYTIASGVYDYWWDKAHNTLRIRSGATELTNGAAITADTIEFEAKFVRGVN